MSLAAKIKLVGFLLILIVVVGAIWFVNSLFVTPSREAKLVYFQVSTGTSAAQIAQDLAAQNLIKSPWVFTTYARLKKAETKFIAGEYKLATDMDVREVMKILTSGEAVDNEKKITIIEGWRADRLAAYLEKEHLVTAAEFLAAIKTEDWRQQYDFLAGVQAETLEGFLFPDTYRVFADTTAPAIVKKMLDNFEQKMTAETRAALQAQDLNLFEVVTLASVVEKEARTEQEKKIVADIFLKRLAVGMGLESDATINYLTGKGDTRPLSQDLAIDSPYNTYKYRGLPPGPICNPSWSAIMAVIKPAANDYYFFLYGTDGQIHLGRTFNEHQANIKKYLK